MTVNISRRSDVGYFSKNSVGMWGAHLVPFYLSGVQTIFRLPLPCFVYAP